MKSNIAKSLFAIVPAMLMMAASCGNSGSGDATGVEVPSEIQVGTAVLKMVNVEPTSFTSGIAPSGIKAKGATIRQVVLSGYSISAAPVSQEVWTAVMGSNPSSTQSAELPVDMVSYKDCLKFIAKLSKMTGIPFSMPSEAQWECAVLSGKSAVAEKFVEMCEDTFVDTPAQELAIDPLEVGKITQKVARQKALRTVYEDYSKSPLYTFHVVVNTKVPVTEEIKRAFIDKDPLRENVSAGEKIKVGSQLITMIGVEGGTFEMGGTKEQGKSAGEDEKPVHEVTVSGFEIAQTEVTAGLWLEVMGSLPYGNKDSEPNKPVVNVSWYDCQEFLLKLNALTGRKFRLPTEAEWEYAARGGRYSRHTTLSGSIYTVQVAAYIDNASSKVVPVKKYLANELGIYDMSGNAWEWCQDSYAPYSEAAVTDPYVNEPGEMRVMRGGSAASRWDACRVSNRSGIPASSMKGTFGFRLAL